MINKTEDERVRAQKERVDFADVLHNPVWERDQSEWLRKGPASTNSDTPMAVAHLEHTFIPCL